MYSFTQISDITKGYMGMKKIKWIGMSLCLLLLLGWMAYLFIYSSRSETAEKPILRSKPSIAILYIATNRYTVFWDDFYSSMEKNFLPEYPKHYFFFTDDKDLVVPDNVTKVLIGPLKFPFVSLMRWAFFDSIKDLLSQYDYIYFLNGNAEVIRPVHDEILPTKEQEGLMFAWHPGYYRHRNPFGFPYDRNPRSTAYIMMGQGKVYIQGGFNGGRSEDFLKMTEVILERTLIDVKEKQMARWHDESHLNRYVLDLKNPLVMDPRYIWAPFDWSYYDEIKDDIRIIMKHKGEKKYGGLLHLRKERDSADYSLFLVHTNWQDQMLPKAESHLYCRKTQPQDCGTLVLNGNQLEVRWERYDPKIFVKKDNAFVLSKIE